MSAARKLRFFDAHCHLQDPRLAHCVDRVISESLDLGVERLSCNGCCEEDWAKVLELSEKHPQLIPNFGLHPWCGSHRAGTHVSNYLQECQKSNTATKCGLDKLRSKEDGCSLGEQETVFRRQLQLGKELHRPISVHCVQAYGALRDAVTEEGPFPAGLILHSWAGSADMVSALSAVPGVCFSLSGHTLRLSQHKLKAMLEQVPLDRLLLETDAPDGLPRLPEEQRSRLICPTAPPGTSNDEGTSTREELNHPGNIRVVLDIVAATMGRPRDEVAAAAFDNASRLFEFASTHQQ